MLVSLGTGWLDIFLASGAAVVLTVLLRLVIWQVSWIYLRKNHMSHCCCDFRRFRKT